MNYVWLERVKLAVGAMFYIASFPEAMKFVPGSYKFAVLKLEN